MKKKALLVSLCAVLLVCVSVFATVAFLSSQDTVTNTFTVGNISMTMDETDNQNPSGNRTDANVYHLIPGSTYTKDPIIHINAGSEDSYVFIHVDNQLAAIEGEQKVASQITANGWTALPEKDGYYYKSVSKSESNTDLTVFNTFSIAQGTNNTTLASYATKKIVVEAFAIQSAGLTLDQAIAQFPATF